MRNELNISLREGERELLSVLALRVRVMTVLQIVRTWPAILSRLSRLEREGFVHSFVAVTHPELPVSAPLVQWRIGDPSPAFTKVSYRLQSRWCKAAVPIKCFIASRASGNMFGGHGGRYPRESEESHDILLAAVFLRFRRLQPELVGSWVHEEELRRDRKDRRGKVPDAMVGKHRVIECGGAYKTKKLIGFHRFCEARGYEYEVW
jgi:hypothetical protein